MALLLAVLREEQKMLKAALLGWVARLLAVLQ